MNRSMPGLPVHHQFPESTQTPVHWVSDAIQPSCLLSLPSFRAFNLSSIRVFSSESAFHNRWLKYWNFIFSISSSNEYSGLLPLELTSLISLQSLKSLFQHRSLKESVLQHSAFFTVQIYHPYVTTGKPIFDYTDLCWQSNISAFLCCLGLS